MTQEPHETMDDDLDPVIGRQFDVLDRISPPDVWRRVAAANGNKRDAASGGRRPAVVLVAATVLALVVAGVIVLANRPNGTAPSAVPAASSTVVASSGTPAPDTAATTPPGRVGTAVASPPTVERGGTLTVTPSAEIVPNCIRIAAVSILQAFGQEPLGLLWPDGKWWQLPEGSSPTWLACGESPTTDAVTYKIPDDLADGHYVICLTEPASDEGCATFQVITPDDAVARPGTKPTGDWSPSDLSDADASVSVDQRALTLRFLGPAQYSPNNSCSADFRAEVDESATEVRIRLSSRFPEGPVQSCPADGYTRTVSVRLESPLGGRVVTLGSAERGLVVFDERMIAIPGWLPQDWEPDSRDAEAGPSMRGGWVQGWGPRAGTEDCSEAGFTLYQGPPSLLDDFEQARSGYPRAPSSTHDVNGTPAVHYSSDGGVPPAELDWTVNGQSFVLISYARCTRYGPASLETMLRFARNLTVPEV